jgi:CDP-diacylglycerol--serine O-phosphatidyltransferase
MKVVSDKSSPKRPKGRIRRLRNVAVLPTMLTLGNLLCGFAAIYFCMRGLFSADMDPAIKMTFGSRRLEEFLPTFISVGGFLIFLGMFFDMLDGRIARMTSGTTNFGGQLDSLADMVTFGLAPAFLMIALVTLAAHTRGIGQPMGRPPNAAHAEAAEAATEQASVASPDRMLVSSRGAWMAGAIFAACCALRLARFNVEHSESDLKHRSFMGLPSPGAAAVVAAHVILYEHVAEVRGWWLANLLPGITIVAAVLMVSSIRYIHIANRYFSGRKPFSYFFILLVAVALLLRWPAPTLACITSLYALSGPAGWAIQRARGKRPGPAVVAEQPKDERTTRRSTRRGTV